MMLLNLSAASALTDIIYIVHLTWFEPMPPTINPCGLTMNTLKLLMSNKQIKSGG